MKIKIEALYALNDKVYHERTEEMDFSIYTRTVKIHELDDLTIMDGVFDAPSFFDTQEYVKVVNVKGSSLIPFLLEKEKSKVLQKLLVEHSNDD
jgi:hypothetical protein